MGRKYTIGLLLFFITTSCGQVSTDIENLQQENEQLKAQIESLKQELEKVKNEPDRLFRLAEQSYKSENYDEALKYINDFLNKYPGDERYESAQTLAKEIENAMKKVKEEEDKRMAEATSKMIGEFDEVEEITWYQDKSTQNKGESIYLYFGYVENKPPWLRMVIRYEGASWLFIESYKIKTDSDTYEIFVDYDSLRRNVISDGITEVFDTNPIDYMDMIADIILSKKTIIRFVGEDSSRDYEVTDQEKQAMQNVLDAFTAMGGTF